MNGDKDKQNNLVNTTDCLEAVEVCKGWKNFLFIIVALCLILLQISFWLVNTGYVKAETAETALAGTASAVGGTVITTPTANEHIVPLERSQTEQSIAEPNALDIRYGGIKKAAEKVTAGEVASSEEKTLQSQKRQIFFDIKIKHLNYIVRFCNFVLIFAAMLYCLTMLFSFKVSLIGRLGGINHICRAFFISLIMVILLLPWQNFFGNFVVGATYSPDELTKWCTAESKGLFDKIVLYLRFSGYWVLIVLLLIFSQIRSFRWSKAILRRLEVI